MARRYWQRALLGCLLIVVAGCASSVTKPEAPPGSSVADPVAHVRCPVVGRASSHAALARFVPVAAVRCEESNRRYPGKGEWLVVTKKRLTTGVQTLLSAFLQPDAKRTDRPCAAYLAVGPIVAFVNANGAFVVPAYPRDECSQPNGSVISAVERASWQLVSVQKDRQVSSEASVASGCSMHWKNELSYRADEKLLSVATPVFGTSPTVRFRVCVYRTPSSDPSVGDLVTAPKLDADASTRLRSALSGAGRAGACSLQREFAVVQLPDPGASWVNVELGGCWRVARSDIPADGIGRADPAATRALVGYPR